MIFSANAVKVEANWQRSQIFFVRKETKILDESIRAFRQLFLIKKISFFSTNLKFLLVFEIGTTCKREKKLSYWTRKMDNPLMTSQIFWLHFVLTHWKSESHFNLTKEHFCIFLTSYFTFLNYQLKQFEFGKKT